MRLDRPVPVKLLLPNCRSENTNNISKGRFASEDFSFFTGQRRRKLRKCGGSFLPYIAWSPGNAACHAGKLKLSGRNLPTCSDGSPISRSDASLSCLPDKLKASLQRRGFAPLIRQVEISKPLWRCVTRWKTHEVNVVEDMALSHSLLCAAYQAFEVCPGQHSLRGVHFADIDWIQNRNRVLCWSDLRVSRQDSGSAPSLWAGERIYPDKESKEVS